VSMNPIEQQLESYFRSEIEGVVPSSSWWTKAVGRAVEQKRTRRRPVFNSRARLAWVLAPLAILLFAGIAFASSSIIRERFMSMFPQVENAGLAQAMDLSQTIDGVTVKVELAYADANGVLVGYTVSGPPTTATGPGARYFSRVGDLVVTNGPVLKSAGASGTVPGSKAVLGNWSPDDRLAVVATFDASPIHGSPATINVRLPINVYDRVPIPEAGQAKQQTFTFDFSITFHEGKTVTPAQTVEAAGVPITLEEVVITPWATRAVFSFDPPYDSIDNRPMLKVTVTPPGGPVTESYEGRNREASTWQYFYDNFSSQTGEWTVVIDELLFPSVNTEWTEEEVNGQKVLIGKGGDPNTLSGPWIFKFNVP
jgi:hypothetical protein